MDPQVTRIGTAGRQAVQHFLGRGNVRNWILSAIGGWKHSPVLEGGGKNSRLRVRVVPRQARLLEQRHYKTGQSSQVKSEAGRTPTSKRVVSVGGSVSVP